MILFTKLGCSKCEHLKQYADLSDIEVQDVTTRPPLTGEEATLMKAENLDPARWDDRALFRTMQKVRSERKEKGLREF